MRWRTRASPTESRRTSGIEKRLHHSFWNWVSMLFRVTTRMRLPRPGCGTSGGCSSGAAMRAAADRERTYLFHTLDGKASERFKSVVERLLLEGGHENVPD